MKDLNSVLKELKTRVTSLYVESLKSVVLFGSWAQS